MNFNEIRSVLSIAVGSTIEHNDNTVPFLWGPPGVGKSACVAEVAEEFNHRMGLKGVLMLGEQPAEGTSPSDYFGLHDIRLSQVDAVEVGGFPSVDREYDVMRRVLGDWFPHTGRDDLPEYGIIFLDEWTSAPQSVQAASYQLANDRRLASHKIKPGWAIIGAGNRIGDGGVVFKQPLPLSNRLCHFDFESDFETFMDFALTRDEIQPWVTAFLRFRIDQLNTFEDHIEKKTRGGAFATERTWHRFSKVCEYVGENDNQAIRAYAHAYLGPGVATEAMAFRDTWEALPDIDAIIKSPAKAAVPTKPDVLYATCGALAAKATPANMENVVTYAERLPASFTVLCIQDAVKRNAANANTAAFTRYAPKFNADYV